MQEATFRIVVAVALMCALWSADAHAQVMPGTGADDTNKATGGSSYKIGQLCKFDIEQYCKGIPAKRIRDLKECLAKNERNLLPRCQDHYREAKP